MFLECSEAVVEVKGPAVAFPAAEVVVVAVVDVAVAVVAAAAVVVAVRDGGQVNSMPVAVAGLMAVLPALEVPRRDDTGKPSVPELSDNTGLVVSVLAVDITVEQLQAVLVTAVDVEEEVVVLVEGQEEPLGLSLGRWWEDGGCGGVGCGAGCGGGLREQGEWEEVGSELEEVRWKASL